MMPLEPSIILIIKGYLMTGLLEWKKLNELSLSKFLILIILLTIRVLIPIRKILIYKFKSEIQKDIAIHYSDNLLNNKYIDLPIHITTIITNLLFIDLDQDLDIFSASSLLILLNNSDYLKS